MNKIKSRYRVSYAFTGFSVNNLIPFVQVLIICLTINAAFPKPPVTLAELTALLKALQDATNNMAQNNNPQMTALRDQAWENLLDAVRKIASYVQSIALNNLAMLLSSGLKNVPTPSASTPLDAPSIMDSLNLATTQVLIRLTPIDNANSYEIRLTSDGGKTWISGGISSQSRRIVVANLTPGTTYTIQARALGGSTGQSAWSAPVTIMAM